MEQRRGRPYSGLQLQLLDLENVEMGLRKRSEKQGDQEADAAEVAQSCAEGIAVNERLNRVDACRLSLRD